jgi:hypothetical protein
MMAPNKILQFSQLLILFVDDFFLYFLTTFVVSCVHKTLMKNGIYYVRLKCINRFCVCVGVILLCTRCIIPIFTNYMRNLRSVITLVYLLGTWYYFCVYVCGRKQLRQTADSRLADSLLGRRRLCSARGLGRDAGRGCHGSVVTRRPAGPQAHLVASYLSLKLSVSLCQARSLSTFRLFCAPHPHAILIDIRISVVLFCHHNRYWMRMGGWEVLVLAMHKALNIFCHWFLLLRHLLVSPVYIYC